MESRYTKCKLEECTYVFKKPQLYDTYCPKHYYRWKKYGDPQVTNPKSISGLSYSLEYKNWYAIKNRCYNSKHPSYWRYGGKGIVMDDRWRDSFLAFYEDMGKRPTPKHTVDRIDNTKGYSKDNCRWATVSQQSINRLSNNDFPGVSVVPSRTGEKWLAQLTVDSKTVLSKKFDTALEAIEARVNAEIKYLGEALVR